MQRSLVIASLLSLSTATHAAVTCFGVGNISGSGVYEVNFTTQAITLAFTTPSVSSWSGAASGDTSQSIFAAGTSLVYRIDVVTHAMSALTTDSTLGIRELAYRPASHTLFATDYSKLYAIDTATGAASLIGSFGASFVAGSMEYDPVHDRLLVVNHADSGLYAADPSNAALTLIGGTSDFDTTDIWLDSASGQYYTAGNGPVHLGSLDTASGHITPVAYFGAYSGPLNGLATPLVPEPATAISLIVLPVTFLARRRSR